MKKITKALLLCAFCLGIFWAGTEQVQAAETDSGSCGDSATWSYDGDMKTLTFLGSGEVVLGGWYEYTGEIEVVYITKEITSIKETAFHTMSIDTLQYFLVEDGNSNFATSAGVLFNRNYTKLLFYPTGRAGEYSIPSTVTEIGSYAFSHCQWLTSITSYGNIKKIGEYAFYGCHELTNAPIKEGIEEIGQSAFSYCYSLTAVTIPESVKSLGSYAFDTCLSYNDYYPGLQNVRILGSNTQMGKYVFAWCKE